MILVGSCFGITVVSHKSYTKACVFVSAKCNQKPLFPIRFQFQFQFQSLSDGDADAAARGVGDGGVGVDERQRGVSVGGDSGERQHIPPTQSSRHSRRRRRFPSRRRVRSLSLCPLNWMFRAHQFIELIGCSSKKKKRGQRAVAGDKSGRGLRQFSMKGFVHSPWILYFSVI